MRIVKKVFGNQKRGVVITRASVSMLVALFSLLAPRCVAGISLEQFEQSLEARCSSGEVCSRSLRSPLTIGGYTGVLVQGEQELSADLKVRGHEFRMHVAKSAFGSILLTWDADRHPDLLSGSGLRCLDLTGSEASAIVLKDFSLHGACGEGSAELCPPFVIETRLYDASDPTGQLYSASVLRRANDRPAGDLAIPFSNFTRRGPRGPGRVTCVGAVSLQIKFERFSDVMLEMGPVYTNSIVPMEVVQHLGAAGDDAITAVPEPEAVEEIPPTPTPPTLPVDVVPVPPVEPKLESSPLKDPSPQEGGPNEVEGGNPSSVASGTLVASPAPEGARARPTVAESDEVVFGEVVRR